MIHTHEKFDNNWVGKLKLEIIIFVFASYLREFKIKNLAQLQNPNVSGSMWLEQCYTWKIWQ